MLFSEDWELLGTSSKLGNCSTETMPREGKEVFLGHLLYIKLLDTAVSVVSGLGSFLIPEFWMRQA